MASNDNTFQCSVVTPERAVLDCAARFVAFPSHDGEVGVMRGRAPLLCRLGAGLMRVEAGDGTKSSLFIDGGFAQMVDDRLTILTEQAVEPATLERSAAKTALEEARALPTDTERAFEERQRALERARQQIRHASGS